MPELQCSEDSILLGLVGSLRARLIAAVGAVPVLFERVPSREMRDMALGLAAGVMLSASFLSLIIPALDAAAMRYGEGAVPAAIGCAGMLILGRERPFDGGEVRIAHVHEAARL